jgi:hypothetical protein
MTIVNVALWAVLFVAWIPYTMAVGFSDPVSTEVRWILASTWVMMILLALLRMRRGRPVLG